MEELKAKLVSLEARVALLEGSRSPVASGPVFPNYGKSKGQPIRGATQRDLEYYAEGCRRTLADPDKARFHKQETERLAALEAEMRRQGFDAPDTSADDSIPF